MTDTAELKPVAWRARRYGSSEWEVFGYDPRALKQFSFFEPLYSADALSSLVREMDEAKSIAASAQANVFRLVAAGRDDLELMKETAATVQSLIARATAAEAERDALLQGVRDVDALVSARVAAAEANAARMREVLEAGGGTAVTEDGVVLTIQISGSTLANAIKHMPKAEIFDEGLQEFFQPEVVDDAAFLKEMARALRHEEEDGTTLVHRMLDEAAIHIMHVGGDGVLSAQEVRDRARASLSNTSEGGKGE